MLIKFFGYGEPSATTQVLAAHAAKSGSVASSDLLWIIGGIVVLLAAVAAYFSFIRK